MLVQEVTKKVKHSKPKHEVEELIKKWQKDYDKPVKGRFEFEEARGSASGAVFSFTERVFPGTPIMVYHIKHGEVCIIPKGVAIRLNNTKQKVRVQSVNMAESGAVRGVPNEVEKFSRVKFIPEDFL